MAQYGASASFGGMSNRRMRTLPDLLQMQTFSFASGIFAIKLAPLTP